MGRSPCCSKIGMNTGAWTAVEDKILSAYIKVHGEGNWRSLPKRAGLKRCGKSCRLRWMNYLRPDIKRGNISGDEEDLIIRLHRLLGNRWSLIAGRLPGRTDNEIKNYWNTTLCKKVGAKPTTARQTKQTTPSNNRVPNRKHVTNLASSNDQAVTVVPIRTKASRCTKVITNILAVQQQEQQQQTPDSNNKIQLQLQQSSQGLDIVQDDQPSHLMYTFSSSTTLSSFLMEEGDGNYQDQKKDNNDLLVLNNDYNNNSDWCTQEFGDEPGLESWVMGNGIGDDVGLDLESLISFLNHEERA